MQGISLICNVLLLLCGAIQIHGQVIEFPLGADTINVTVPTGDYLMLAVADWGSSNFNFTVTVNVSVILMENATSFPVRGGRGFEMPFSSGLFQLISQPQYPIIDMGHRGADVALGYLPLSGTAQIHINATILIHNCLLEGAVAGFDQPYVYSSNFGLLAPTEEVTTTQRTRLFNSILYGPNGDWSRILLLTVLQAAPFKEVKGTLERYRPDLILSKATARRITVDTIEGLTVDFPYASYANVTLKSEGISDDITTRLARLGSDSPTKFCNGSLVPPDVLSTTEQGDPLHGCLYRCDDSDSFSEALRLATSEQIYARPATAPPPVVMITKDLTFLASTSSSSASGDQPAASFPILGPLLVIGPTVVTRGTKPVVNLGGVQDLWNVSTGGTLYLQQLSLTGLSTNMVQANTASGTAGMISSSFPLAAVAFADGTAGGSGTPATNNTRVQAYDVTLQLPAPDYMALLDVCRVMSGAETSYSACLDTTASAIRSYLGPLVTRAQNFTVSSNGGRFTLNEFTGLGMSGRLMTFEPETPLSDDLRSFAMGRGCASNAGASPAGQDVRGGGSDDARSKIIGLSVGLGAAVVALVAGVAAWIVTSRRRSDGSDHSLAQLQLGNTTTNRSNSSNMNKYKDPLLECSDASVETRRDYGAQVGSSAQAVPGPVSRLHLYTRQAEQEQRSKWERSDAVGTIHNLRHLAQPGSVNQQPPRVPQQDIQGTNGGGKPARNSLPGSTGPAAALHGEPTSGSSSLSVPAIKGHSGNPSTTSTSTTTTATTRTTETSSQAEPSTNTGTSVGPETKDLGTFEASLDSKAIQQRQAELRDWLNTTTGRVMQRPMDSNTSGTVSGGAGDASQPTMTSSMQPSCVSMNERWWSDPDRGGGTDGGNFSLTPPDVLAQVPPPATPQTVSTPAAASAAVASQVPPPAEDPGDVGPDSVLPHDDAGHVTLTLQPPSGDPDGGSKHQQQHALMAQVANKLSSQADADKVVLKGFLGQGAFGAVYMALYRELPAAVKVLVFEIPEDVSMNTIESVIDAAAGAQHTQHGREMIKYAHALREAAIASSVGHRNIVATYRYDVQRADAAVNDGQGLQVEMARQGVVTYKLILVQELCAMDLRRAMQRSMFVNESNGGVDEMVLLRVLLDICSGLEYLASRGIVHGDLKPDNVLLATDISVPGGVVAKLTDFNLSHHMLKNATHLSGIRSGTPYYIAPETADKGQMSPASDCYALGIMIWEMYTGMPIVEIGPDDEPRWNPTFPGCDQCPTRRPPSAVLNIQYRCLQPDPKARPTAQDMCKVLQHELNVMLSQHQAAATPM